MDEHEQAGNPLSDDELDKTSGGVFEHRSWISNCYRCPACGGTLTAKSISDKAWPFDSVAIWTSTPYVIWICPQCNVTYRDANVLVRVNNDWQ